MLQNPYEALEAIEVDLSAHPTTQFFTITAVIRPWRLPQVVHALGEAGIRGMTVTDVKGLGAQGGSLVVERDAGNECILGSLVEKNKVEIVLCRDQVDFVVRLISTTCFTGSVGDGKIFVSPVSDVIRIRTGETGAVAERMQDGLADKGYNSI
jgi:nitrogen regulatory protein PII